MITNDFRPQKFEELAGQDLNKKILKSIVKKPEKSPRSLILQGYFGSGKSTSARVFARAINCENSQNGDACGKCKVCQDDIQNSPFYEEYDSAVIGNVDKIRNLRDTFHYSIKNGWKVVVFDECLHYSAKVMLADGTRKSIGKIVNQRLPVEVISYNEEKDKYEKKKVTKWHKNLPKPVYKYIFSNDRKTFNLKASDTHVVFTEDGEEVRLKDLDIGDKIKVVKRIKGKSRVKTLNINKGEYIENIDIDGNVYQSEIAKLESIEDIKLYEGYTYDLTVEDNHNYIADDCLVHNCHLASKQAQSALLKVIEEAPERVFFLFATTDIEKVLPTIRSRSLELRFRLVQKDKIIENLKGIAEDMGIKVSEEILELIAIRSRGHMRDAHMYLDQYLMIEEEDFKNAIRSAKNVFLEYFYGVALSDDEKVFTAIDELLTFPLADLKNDFQQTILDLTKILVGVKEGSKLEKEIINILKANTLKIIKQSMSEWVLNSFESDISFKTFLLALYQMIRKINKKPNSKGKSKYSKYKKK